MIEVVKLTTLSTESNDFLETSKILKYARHHGDFRFG